MSSKRWAVEAVRDDILSAIAEVRTVARSESDKQRSHATDWLHELFIGVSDRRGLRSSAAKALSLYGGAGSFSDVGTTESAHAVDRLAKGLRRGRSWFLRNS
jgi:hypothetical protein